MSGLSWEKWDSTDCVIVLRLWVRVGDAEQAKGQMKGGGGILIIPGLEISSDAESQ